MSLPARLLDLAAARGLSDADLSAALGQRPGYVSDLRHGRRWTGPVPPDKLTAFARAVGLTPTALGKLLYECYPGSEKTHESC